MAALTFLPGMARRAAALGSRRIGGAVGASLCPASRRRVCVG
jgi:hypothetical protein